MEEVPPALANLQGSSSYPINYSKQPLQEENCLDCSLIRLKLLAAKPSYMKYLPMERQTPKAFRNTINMI